MGENNGNRILMTYLFTILKTDILIPLAVSTIAVFGMMFIHPAAGIIIVSVLSGISYFLFRKKINRRACINVNRILLLTDALLCLILMVAADGEISLSNRFFIGKLDNIFVLPFFATSIVYELSEMRIIEYLVPMVYFLIAVIVPFFFGIRNEDENVETEYRTDDKRALKYIINIVVTLVIAVSVGVSGYLYRNRPSVRYKGHGFEYMHGRSSTDFADYMVYSDNSKLVILSEKSSLTIENETEMPVLDGAEACYPLYAAFAKAVYKDIDLIEKKAADNLTTEFCKNNGKIVSFTNTVEGFERLVYSDEREDGADMFFGARPSKAQYEMAAEHGVDIDVTAIGREAFVFFVEEDNPVDGLSSEQIKAIYHGDITNWKELGGKDQEIIAFQRPENSGSQAMMEYFMGDVSLKEPMKYEVVASMVGVISNVAQYSGEAGAMSYSFRYFITELNQEKNVKLLSVDGVYPTRDNIKNGSYPLTVGLCLVTRKNDDNENVQRMKEFILSEQGQYIIEETGYAGIR